MFEQWKVVMRSMGGTERTYVDRLTYQEALDICIDNDWQLCPDGGYIWDLDIVESDYGWSEIAEA